MGIKFHTIVVLLCLSRLTSSILWNDDKAFVVPDDTIVVSDDSGKHLSARDIRNVDFSENNLRVENEVDHIEVPAVNNIGRKSKAMLKTLGRERKKRGAKKTKSPKHTKSPMETKNPVDGKGYLKTTKAPAYSKSPMETKNPVVGKGYLKTTKAPAYSKSPMETKNPVNGKGYLKTTKAPAYSKSPMETKNPVDGKGYLKKTNSPTKKKAKSRKSKSSKSSKSDKNTKAPRKSVKKTKAPTFQPPILFVLEICTSCLNDNFPLNLQNEIESIILEFGFKKKVEASEIKAKIEVTNDECLPCALNTERRNLQDSENNQITLLRNTLSFEIETQEKNGFNSSKVIANLQKNQKKINEILEKVQTILNDVQAPSSSPSLQPSMSMAPSSTPSSIPSVLPTQLPTSAPSGK